MREATSEAEAMVALKRPTATVVKVRMSTVTEVHGRACQSVRTIQFLSWDRSICEGGDCGQSAEADADAGIGGLTEQASRRRNREPS